MATSEQNPSPALLRLRPADVVRLCGLNAAATGLDLADSHHVISGQRDGSKLFATVTDDPPHVMWVEITGEVDSARWSCDCAHTGPLACEHVAATLSAWIAHPSDFITHENNLLSDTTEAGAHQPPDGASSPSQAQRLLDERVAPSADVLTLALSLARMNAPDIDTIAHRILGPDFTGAAEDARRGIIAALSDPERLQALLHRLDSSARTLLMLIDLAGGAMTAADLEELSSRIARPLSAVQGDIGILERHALLLPMLPSSAPSKHGPGSSWRHVAGWRIPDEVRRAFVATLPLDSLPAQGGGRSAPPMNAQGGAPLHVLRSTPRALCLALALLADAPPPLGLPRALAATSSTAAPVRHGAGLLAPGELAPDRLKELARGAGLDVAAARLARRLLRQSREQHPAPPIADIARVPVAERPLVLRGAFRRWLRADSAADLLDLEALSGVRVRYATAHPGFRPAAIANEVSSARRFVARMLSRAHTETWYSLERLIMLAWQAHPGMLRGQQQSWATPVWWLETTHEKRVLRQQSPEDWMAGEGAFIASLVAGAFASWGAVDVASREGGKAVAFRLTPFGAFLFRRDNSPADSLMVAQCDADWGPPVLPLREGTLAVQPLAAAANLLDALAFWANPTAISGKRLVYSLSADRACAAFDQQLSPGSLPAIVRPLHSRAADTIANQLNQWHAEWGRTHITTGFTLLEANDEATLVEALAAVPDIATRCRRIGPTLALALPEDTDILRRLLARRGYAV